MLCLDCKKEGKEVWVEDNRMTQHQEQVHSQEIIHTTIQAIIGTEERVQYILEHNKAAQSNPGVLVEKYMQYFPFKGYRIIYDATTGQVQMPTFATYEDAIYFIKYMGTISRCDRAVRSKFPTLNGSPRARARRAVEEQFSRGFWPNHYEGGLE
jgi:hypothetical protein